MELAKQKNYQQAFDLASATLKGMDLAARGRCAGAQYRKGKEGETLVIDFFAESHHVLFPQVEFRCSTQKTVSLVSRVLLLHYLLRADGSPITGKWVSYKDIPGGLLYTHVFEKRVTHPLAKRFGRWGKLFLDAGQKLGGTSVGVGDASFIIRALPRVPLHYILWEGDEEFPPSVQLLFDSSVDHYLSLEDIVVLGQMATGRLVRRSLS